jgi:ABC-type glycerol-3-phosphate transport system permease component
MKSLPALDQKSFVPKTWDMSNYLELLKISRGKDEGMPQRVHVDFGRWYFNSLYIAGWVTFLQLITCSTGAYAFSRIQWPGRDKVFFMYITTMMIPTLILIIPNYYVMQQLKLVNTYLGLILPPAFSVFGTFILRQMMLKIPHEYDESAKMDGAGHFRIFMEIILPLCKPGLITLGIFAFLGSYGSFFWPLILTKDQWLYTLPVGMLYFSELYSQQTNILMAASLLNIVPPILVFIVLQKYLVQGVELGISR